MDGHDVYHVTQEGMKVLDDLESVLVRLTP